jgi:TetR/AcrR family transcriptional repressor of nem operon
VSAQAGRPVAYSGAYAGRVARTGRPREFDEDSVVLGAADLFWSRGYAGTSVQDIADSLALQRPSLYGAFGGKRGLFLRALESYIGGVLEALAVLDRPGPVLPNLRTALLSAAEPSPTGAFRGCMLGNTAVELAGSDETIRRTVADGFARTEAAFRAAVLRAQTSGEIPRGDVRARAALLLVVLEGLHVVARAGAGPERLALAVDAALEGMAARPAPARRLVRTPRGAAASGPTLPQLD